MGGQGTHWSHPRELNRDMAELTRAHVSFMERLLEIWRIQVMVAKPESVFTDDVRSKGAERFVDGESFTIIPVFRNVLAKNFDFISNDGLEAEDASLGEMWVQSAPTELVKATVWRRKD